MLDYRTSRINGTTSLNTNCTFAASLLVGRVLSCENAYDDSFKCMATTCSLQSP